MADQKPRMLTVVNTPRPSPPSPSPERAESDFASYMRKIEVLKINRISMVKGTSCIISSKCTGYCENYANENALITFQGQYSVYQIKQ